MIPENRVGVPIAVSGRILDPIKLYHVTGNGTVPWLGRGAGEGRAKKKAGAPQQEKLGEMS